MSKVSVVMPVYNTKADYFKEAIDSVLGQSFQDFELLIVDNGSDIYIKDIVKSYKDEKIKYFRIDKNKESAIARNKAIDLAQSEYIAFIDSDDISLPQRLEKQVMFLDNNPDVGCLGTAVEIIGDDSEKMRFASVREHSEIECYMLFFGCAFCQSSVMVRKFTLDKFNIRYRSEWFPTEDYGLFVDLVDRTKFKIIDEVLVKYRFHHNNTSHLYSNEQKEKSRIVQTFAINKCCEMLVSNKNLLSRFILEENLKVTELNELAEIINNLMKYLSKRGYSENDVMYALKRKIKYVFYHNHSFRVQWILMHSPINKIFHFPLWWRLMCLITRGIF